MGSQEKRIPDLPVEIKSLKVSAQKYAVFRHHDHIAGIRATYTVIWSKWFRESGYQAAAAPNFERYGPEFNPITGTGGLEIWIPIES